MQVARLGAFDLVFCRNALIGWRVRSSPAAIWCLAPPRLWSVSLADAKPTNAGARGRGRSALARVPARPRPHKRDRSVAVEYRPLNLRKELDSQQLVFERKSYILCYCRLCYGGLCELLEQLGRFQNPIYPWAAEVASVMVRSMY